MRKLNFSGLTFVLRNYPFLWFSSEACSCLCPLGPQLWHVIGRLRRLIELEFGGHILSCSSRQTRLGFLGITFSIGYWRGGFELLGHCFLWSNRKNLMCICLHVHFLLVPSTNILYRWLLPTPNTTYRVSTWNSRQIPLPTTATPSL